MNRFQVLAGLIAAPVFLTDCASPGGQARPTQVLVIASLHGAHRDHPTYPYEALYEAVRNFRPDAVGVEIRQEDLGRDATYLSANYPQEMVALAAEFGPRAFGFDWLGDDLAGRPVPDGYWKTESWVKRLERQKESDRGVATPKADAIQAEQVRIIKSATPAALNDGRYDALNRRYYRLLGQELAGTAYAPLTRFYARRDQIIAESISREVRHRPGRRVAVILGADHRGRAVEALRRLPRVVLSPVG